MKKTVLVIACLFVAGAAGAAQVSSSALSSSVVHVTTEESDGTGFVIGADEQTVFIATAKHVVPSGVGGLHVQFHGAPHRSLAGRVFRRSGDVDLAIILVDVAADDSIRRSLKPLPYRSGRVPMLTTVSNIAIADDRWFSNFEVNKLQDDELNVLGFSKSGVTQGASGGPLFDDGYRLIGMVTEVSGVKATALKIDAILALLSSWHVPVNLLEAKRSGKAIVPVEESKKIAITDERGHSVAGLVQVAQRVAADGYAVVGKVSENSEKSTELAGLITVHMSLDVTVRNAGGAVAAHILLTSHGGGFQQEDARAQALERLVADFEERLAQEVP